MAPNPGGRCFFEKNLAALSAKDPELCARLSKAHSAPAHSAPAHSAPAHSAPAHSAPAHSAPAHSAPARSGTGRYTFTVSRTGAPVPAIADGSGAYRALHSAVDPEKEARRLADVLYEGRKEPCFTVFLGLGGGYAPEAALGAGTASRALVIDFDINGVAGLLCSREYTALGDPRLTLLVDPDADIIRGTVLGLYNPCLCGGVATLPLRARVGLDAEKFDMAAEAVRTAIEKVSADYSVQAHFGIRWFSNIIRNLAFARPPNADPPRIDPALTAAVCAAGPSLDAQIPLIQKRRDSLFVIAADTALPALLSGGVKPDAVASIDCQHISYYHFISTGRTDIPLFLDIASPPLLSGFSSSPFFFAGGHPLAAYLRLKRMPLPVLDTSGGNVAYACLSLAEKLGAKRVTVYGADFSYPLGRPYARGTYFYPLFERRQNRLAPLEARVSSFLYRTPFLPLENGKIKGGVTPCYETGTLRSYRKSFEEKASAMEAGVVAEKGMGIPLEIRRKTGGSPSPAGRTDNFAYGGAITDAKDFLNGYKKDITALPAFGRAVTGDEYMARLNPDEKRVFTTLLPLIAALKKRRPDTAMRDLVEAAKAYCAREITEITNNDFA